MVMCDVSAAPDPRTCAIYYFLTAVFVLLVAFDTFFALPMLVSLALLSLMVVCTLMEMSCDLFVHIAVLCCF